MNGILLRIPGLCRTENLPKLPELQREPVRAQIVEQRGFKRRDHGIQDVSASFLVGSANAC